MTDKNVDINAQHEMVQCEVCFAEIPDTAAKTFEGSDYMHYFCGLDCLGKWQEQQKKSREGENRPGSL